MKAHVYVHKRVDKIQLRKFGVEMLQAFLPHTHIIVQSLPNKHHPHKSTCGSSLVNTNANMLQDIPNTAPVLYMNNSPYYYAVESS